MIAIHWDGGGEATVTSMSGDQVSLRSTVPFPPGSRPQGRVGEIRIRVKVHGSRKDGEQFVVQGRFLDLTREHRETLERLL